MVGQDHDNQEPGRTGPGGAEESTRDAVAEPSVEDDVRRKFRETLQRKQQHHQARHLAGGTAFAGPKVREGFGPARGRREFRRKSGG
jgi:hypothetical protein